MQFATVLLAVVLCLPYQATAPKSDTLKYPEISRELVAMGQEDQKYRQMLQEMMLKVSESKNDPASVKRIEEAEHKQSEIDQKNLKRLEEIVAKIGWPGKSLVGNEANVAAFLIIQHSELPTQEKYLPMLKEAATKGETRPADAAMLEDRVLMRQGKKQIYGTQLQSNAESEFKLRLVPIEDEEHVDERRAKVGLGPLKEYLKIFGLEYTPTKSN